MGKGTLNILHNGLWVTAGNGDALVKFREGTFVWVSAYNSASNNMATHNRIGTCEKFDDPN